MAPPASADGEPPTPGPPQDPGGERLATFDAFWPFYLSQHSQRGCRVLHYLGTPSALVIATVALLSGGPRFLLLAVLVGYPPAWIAHAAIERNRPATFRYPLWSL